MIRILVVLLLLMVSPQFVAMAQTERDLQLKSEPVPPVAAVAVETAEIPRTPPNLHPSPPEPIRSDQLERAIARGIEFLIKDQNRDGSWGSAERTKDLNIMAGIGSHHAFRTAVTALCVSSLIELDEG